MDEPHTPVKRNALGDWNPNAGSPISPMANLKLLTKVATAEHVDPNGAKPARSLRSLSFICKKFLEMFGWDLPDGTYKTISIVSLAAALGIEKRRVYDVMNVVVSLQMAVKVCKDKYQWYGYQHLERALSRLKQLAKSNKFRDQLDKQIELESVPGEDSLGETSVGLEVFSGRFLNENRIGVLCQKFLMLYLVVDRGTPLSLHLVSKLVLTKDIQYTTGMRRLYDVANALVAMGLVVRCNDPSVRKPSFIYCGPNPDLLDSDPSPDLPPLETSSDASEFDSGSNSTFSDEWENVDSLVNWQPVEPPAKKRLIFPRQSPDRSVVTVEQPIVVDRLEQNQPITLARAPFSLKRIIPKQPPRLLNEDEAQKYRAKYGILRSQTHLNPQNCIRISNIQEGGVYKAVKDFDGFRLVKL